MSKELLGVHEVPEIRIYKDINNYVTVDMKEYTELEVL